MIKRTGVLLVCLALAACDNSAPAGGAGYFDQVGTPPPVPLAKQQVPPPQDMTGSLSTAVENALATTRPGATPTAGNVPAPTQIAPGGAPTIATDDGTLDLNASSLDQQVIERNEAARKLAEARERLTIIEPGTLPEIVAGVNIAAYARSTTHPVGQKIHRRPIIKTRFSSTECRKFPTADDAQRYFLANGGPQKDPLNLDPDGDGFACKWSPDYFRQLR